MVNKNISKIITLIIGILLFGAYLIISKSYHQPPLNSIVGTENETLNATKSINLPTVTDIIDVVCKENFSHISFLSSQNLYLISGTDCFPQLLMEDVSDSPTWSPDGRWIAVGCENEAKLCLIEINQISENKIISKVSKVFELPKNCSGKRIRSISWSPDGNFIALVCVAEGKLTEIYILNLQLKNYQKIITDNEILRAIWSPIDDIMVISTLKGEIYTTDLQGNNRKFLTIGWSPEWSFDGQQFIFIKPNDDKDNPKNGIAIFNLGDQKIKWLYLPNGNPEETNLILNCGDLRFDCRLAWSPDGHYVAVGARHGYMFNWDIFLLDIVTGEIINMTEKFEKIQNYEPDWSP